mmetsp:Transcript_26145/g.66360  ORF Transcript_26145/g.66360 Transcript_26145/m.66360 type:complete len:233 (+) Transcript_26145:4356-5054(+)
MLKSASNSVDCGRDGIDARECGRVSPPDARERLLPDFGALLASTLFFTSSITFFLCLSLSFSKNSFTSPCAPTNSGRGDEVTLLIARTRTIISCVMSPTGEYRAEGTITFSPTSPSFMSDFTPFFSPSSSKYSSTSSCKRSSSMLTPARVLIRFGLPLTGDFGFCRAPGSKREERDTSGWCEAPATTLTPTSSIPLVSTSLLLAEGLCVGENKVAGVVFFEGDLGELPSFLS